MARVYEAFVTYSADATQLWRATDSFRGQIVGKLSSAGNAAGKAFGAAFSVAAGVGLAAFTAGAAATVMIAKQSIDAAIEQEAAEKKLAAVLRATGGAAGFTVKELADYAAQLQAVTTFSDDAILESASVLATFRNVTGDSFKGALEAAMDMSEVMGTDLKGSVMQVAKALQDPVQGITALRRAGVSFTKDQRELIKSLVESGRTLEAQQMILKELNSEFGGAARAAVGSYAGAWKNLQNQLAESKEAIGFAILPHLRELGPLLQTGADGAAAFAGELARMLGSTTTGGLGEVNDLTAQAVALVLSLGDAWELAQLEAGSYLVNSEAALAKFLKWGNTPIGEMGNPDAVSNSESLDKWKKKTDGMQRTLEQLRANASQSMSDRLERIRGEMEKVKTGRLTGSSTAAAGPAGKAPKLPFNPIDAFLGIGYAARAIHDKGGLFDRIGGGIGMAGLATAGGLGAGASGFADLMAGMTAGKKKEGRFEFVGFDQLNAKLQSSMGSKTPEEKRRDREEKRMGELITVTKEMVGKGIQDAVKAIKGMNLGFVS